jgi:hypothetical protein
LFLKQPNRAGNSKPFTGSVAIPTGITDPAAATRAWLDTIPPDEKARSDAYSKAAIG